MSCSRFDLPRGLKRSLAGFGRPVRSQYPVLAFQETPSRPGGSKPAADTVGPTGRKEWPGPAAQAPLPAAPNQQSQVATGRGSLVSVNDLSLPASPGPVANACCRHPRAPVFVTAPPPGPAQRRLDLLRCAYPESTGPAVRDQRHEDVRPTPELGSGPPGPSRLPPTVCLPRSSPPNGPTRRRPAASPRDSPAPPRRPRSGSSTSGSTGSDSPAPTTPRRPKPGPSTTPASWDSASVAGPSTSAPPVRLRRPTLARNVLKVYLPAPATFRCSKRGCGSSYGGASWTSRVQPLRRHYEHEHGLRIRERLSLCSACNEALRERPSSHPCLQ
ncbi:hypothetical protein MTO96_029519 [Rhipicephalus appendiculatus]